jgi:LysM repeat protein
MSAAPEFPPIVYIPERARTKRVDDRRRGSLVVVPAGLLVAPTPSDVNGSTPSSWSRTSWHRASSIEAPMVDLATMPATSPLRLTRRGVVVVAALAVVAAALLALLAWRSAPAASAQPASVSSVTVQPGDTLWSVALNVAPDSDPRAEVDKLTSLNHLSGASLVPGQVLRTH